MVLLSTHNICFGWEIRKIIFSLYILLSGSLQARSGSKLQGKVIHRLCYLLLKHYHEIYFNIYDAPLYEAVGFIDLILVLEYAQLLKMHILLFDVKEHIYFVLVNVHLNISGHQQWSLKPHRIINWCSYWVHISKYLSTTINKIKIQWLIILTNISQYIFNTTYFN